MVHFFAHKFKMHYLAILAIICFVLPTVAFSAPAAGKVRSALGSVDRWKAKQNEWAALRVGANIYQSDKVRTGEESEVIFALPDGSMITIAENAEVEISDLLKPNEQGGFETRLDIKKGHVNFAVHKLQDKKSNFTFKTGTATAAIRGTEGYIGGEGVFFAGLKSGKLEIVPNGKTESVSIAAGETTFGSDSLVVLKLASSGDARFAKKLEKILLDKSRSVTELIQDIQKADTVFQTELVEEAKKAANALPENGFALNTTSPVEVCNDGLLVEGAYSTSDETATLVLKVGSFTSANLIRATDGVQHYFTQKVMLNDENGLWTAKKATLTFNGAGLNITKSIDINVNKSCASVNGKAPTAAILSYDSLRCNANISIGEMQHDAGIVIVTADGSPVSEDAVSKNMQKRVKLKEGRHDYTVTVTDQAGNKVEDSKAMGCYPVKRFTVDILGKAKEVLKVPPPPKGIADRIVQTLQFRIRLSDNSTENLYKVTVKQNGKVILQETLSQIQNLDYQIPIELTRGSPNRINVEVVHKSGFKAKAQKVYEVH